MAERVITDRGKLTAIADAVREAEGAEQTYTLAAIAGKPAEWRKSIADAITAKGVDTLQNASFDTLATNIGLIDGGGEWQYEEKEVLSNSSVTRWQLTPSLPAEGGTWTFAIFGIYPKNDEDWTTNTIGRVNRGNSLNQFVNNATKMQSMCVRRHNGYVYFGTSASGVETSEMIGLYLHWGTVPCDLIGYCLHN